MTFGTTSIISTGTAVGFGASETGLGLTGGSVNINALDNMAFTAPRDLKITAISAYFAVSEAVTLSNVITIQAQLYVSETPNEVFTPVGTAVTLSPSFNGIVAAGSSASGLDSTQTISVSAGSRLMLVFYGLAATAFTTETAITGHCSGSILIK